MRRTIQLNTVPEERALRAGEFLLTSDTTALPFIVSQPVNNFKQFTWLQDIQYNIPIFQYIKSSNNKIIMLQGTEFSLGIESVDLSNTLNINDTTNLSYTWTRDEAPIYELNGMNGGIGTNTFLVPAASSSLDLSGRYVCEVSNAFGSVESDPIDIEIVDPIKHPKLLKNLILNGDGDGGLDGWQADPGFLVKPFINDPSATWLFGSFRLATWTGTSVNGWLMYDGKRNMDLLVGPYPREFYFSSGDDSSMFYNQYKFRWDADPSYRILNASSTTGVFGQLNWYLDANLNYNIVPQIIPNEDYVYTQYSSSNSHAAFYPGIRFMDKYNKNYSWNSTTLLDEYTNYESQYFTRDRIKFESLGGSKEVKMTQTVDLSEVADMIDGNVYGIKYTTSQFFAYVGAGITGYSVKIQTVDGVKSYNYYLKDIETYFNKHYLSQDPAQGPMADFNRNLDNYVFVGNEFGNIGPNQNVVASGFYNNLRQRIFWNGDGALSFTNFWSSDPDQSNDTVTVQKVVPIIEPIPGTVIEMTPLVEDRTSIVLEYLDEYENILKTEVIDGPSDRDVWAIKEKVFFPLTLYGLYEFVAPNNNPITVFGQTYTTTEAIKALFSSTQKPKDIRSTIRGSQTNGIGNRVTDVNAKFLLNKMNLNNNAYPAGFGFGNNASEDIHKTLRAVNDFGAAAMFGVGKNIVVPTKTRSVRVTIKFENQTRAFKDISPKLKLWEDQEIYSNDFGDGTSTGMRPHEYGNPRCGITSIKFLLSPNDFEISEKYTSYQLPPLSSTVVGIQKAKYTIPDAFNSAIKQTFEYPLEVPQSVPSPEPVQDPYLQVQDYYDSINGLDIQALINAGSGSINFDPLVDPLPDDTAQ